MKRIKRAIHFVVILILPIFVSGCLGLTSDGQQQPEIQIATVPVNKPTATSCVPKSVRPAPAYPDSDSALRASAGSPDRFLQLLLAGRDKRDARLAEIEPVIEGCRK